MDSLNYDLLAAALVRQGFGGTKVVSPAPVEAAPNAITGDGVAFAREAPAAGGGGGEALVDETSGSDSGSSEAWCDAAQEVEEAVVFARGAGRVAVSDKVREAVRFGGLADRYEVATESGPKPKGFFATVVRSEAAKGLAKRVASLSGAKLPRTAAIDVAVCTYTAGTMPSELVEGKKRLKALAALGDGVITVHLIAAAMARGMDVESVSWARARYTSDAMLRTKCLASGLLDCVSFPPGVDRATSKPTATALEAMVGLVAIYRDDATVTRFIEMLGLFSFDQ